MKLQINIPVIISKKTRKNSRDERNYFSTEFFIGEIS